MAYVHYDVIMIVLCDVLFLLVNKEQFDKHRAHNRTGYDSLYAEG